MSLIEKLQKSRVFGYIKPGQYGITGYESEVADLVRQIEAKAAEQNLTVSRWLTNSTAHGWAQTITWAVHEGPRPSRTNLLPEGAHVVTLNSTEGTTKMCEAYCKLSELLGSLMEEHWLADAEQAAADLADEQATQQDAIGG